VPDLNFAVVGAEPEPHAASPLLAFKLRIQENARGLAPTPIAAVALRCQIRIEPTRRTYSAQSRDLLGDLFGEPARWGQTLKSALWTHGSIVVPPFTETTEVDLPVPCSFDFNVAATKYFHALDDGEVPLTFLFSGTIFYNSADGPLHISQISWEKEASFRLPVATWKAMIDHYYPHCAWLCLERAAFDRLHQFKTQRGIPTWERAIEALLDASLEKVES
jgi:hypothetical protein